MAQSKPIYSAKITPGKAASLIRSKTISYSFWKPIPYSATQIFQRLQEENFDGGFTIVKEYVRKIRPQRVEPFLKLSFAPGECAQVDWGSYGSVNVGGYPAQTELFCHGALLQPHDVC